MPLSDYNVEKWEISSSSVHAKARKGRSVYQLKRYTNVPYPAGQDMKAEHVRRQAARCQKLFEYRLQLNQRLREASGRSHVFAYAEEVFLSKTSEDPGVIEAVPFVPGAMSVEDIRAKESRLYDAMRTSAAALARLHAIKVVHADIKPENILFVPRGLSGASVSAVLIDFDSSYPVKLVPKPTGVGGSDGYIAPEVCAYADDPDCQDDGSDSVYRAKLTTARDVFSLGAVFCFLLTGKVPELLDNSVCYDRDAVNARMRTDYLCDLIDAMLAWEPKDRPTAEAVAESLRTRRLCFSVEPFEALWPEHAARLVYAGDIEKRYKRVRRLNAGGEHQYTVTFHTGDAEVYTVQMLLNTGALRRAPGGVSSGSGKAAKTGNFTLGGTLFEENMLWPEHESFVIDRERLSYWGYEAFYRISKGTKRAYAIYKPSGGYQKKLFAELRQDMILIEK